MSFSYNPTGTFTNLERVRFHISDKDPKAPKFSDEEIEAVIADAGSWQKAVIVCIRSLMAAVSMPNFSADWLTVDNASAYKSLEALLQQKQRELGQTALTVNSVHVYRADGQMTSAPTFTQVDEEAGF